MRRNRRNREYWMYAATPTVPCKYQLGCFVNRFSIEPQRLRLDCKLSARVRSLPDGLLLYLRDATVLMVGLSQSAETYFSAVLLVV